MAKYYPINLALEGKKCLVVGGGKVAERKVKRLLDCRARVKVISLKIGQGLEKMAKDEKITYINRRVNLKDIAGAYLVISATDDKKINSFVSTHCKEKGILVNVADAPGESNFILPSIITRGDLTIAVSTGGISPALSKKIRQNLEKKIGPEYVKFLRIMKKMRPQALKKIKNQKTRKEFFDRAVSADIFAFLKRNKEKQALQKLECILKNV